MTSGFLVLLPPSETKRDGGISAFGPDAPAAASLAEAARDPSASLSWPSMGSVRDELVGDLVALAGDAERMAAAFKLSDKLAAVEAERNRALRTAPRLPAVLRYTGVLYDALDAGSLDAEACRWLAGHVAIHSALYGLVGAGEPIAAYRCSANSRLPGRSLKQRWASRVADALTAHDGTVLDLRSNGYRALGAAGARSIVADIVTDDGAGGVRALNHFNKQAKGELVRALAVSERGRALPPDVDVDRLCATLGEVGFHAEPVSASRLRCWANDSVHA
ncbi:UPF0246 protein Cgl1995/cg2186 [Pseudoclavibacter endophyticus]|uniref:Peroxide stress protein YaaA n=1 Tax=Pseudoclavibacter endophyticus TaxID=1778590 RepID=A0A6H9WM26_9MICO|nr:peroxide stress protein YaaA [Pseudoclavibacter endophyticus]KAB1649896.1 peroxide stress protein YaaA [Pseudoclavibacter endophyticus]GGA58908.1 UPF0246 protein Cgl1995/cg2186 [Pseudoclavibacter endophyticus]